MRYWLTVTVDVPPGYDPPAPEDLVLPCVVAGPLVRRWPGRMSLGLVIDVAGAHDAFAVANSYLVASGVSDPQRLRVELQPERR